jgi:hypothetical protein
MSILFFRAGAGRSGGKIRPFGIILKKLLCKLVNSWSSLPWHFPVACKSSQIPRFWKADFWDLFGNKIVFRNNSFIPEQVTYSGTSTLFRDKSRIPGQNEFRNQWLVYLWFRPTIVPYFLSNSIWCCLPGFLLQFRGELPCVLLFLLRNYPNPW